MSLRVSMSSWLNLACSGLMYSSVPMHLAELGEHRPFGELLGRGFGHAEVDHFRHRLVVVLGDQHVRGLDVAMDDAFLMGVLHRLADRHEQFQPLRGAADVSRRSTA